MSPYRVDARMSGRHPFEVYMLFLCFLVSLPAVIGQPAVPGSVRAALPELASTAWSISLLVGAGVALVGIYLKNRIAGLIIEQVGLALTGVACIIYAAAIIPAQGWDGAIGTAIVGGFGLSCGRRYFQIQHIIDEIQLIQQEREHGRGES